MRSVLLLAALATTAHATQAGLDIGHVVDHAVVHDQIAAVDSTGASWVRINFRLDDWTAPDDATPRGPAQLTWFAAYDRIIDGYVARGIQVYGLVNDEAVASSLDHNGDAWIALYVANAVKIVDHFKNRVRVFELINEPNDYAGGTTARFTPAAFAKILQDTYLAVKHDGGHAGDQCWQVKLISGPLFSFDNNASADYLAQTYATGRSQLAWDYTHQATGSYPLDGIGYHMYVAQGASSSTADVGVQMAQNLGAVWNVVTANDDGAAHKQLWVSEYGWQAATVGADGQAARMAAGFAAMKQFGQIALAAYFNFEDFPGATYGVFDATGARRTAADMLGSLAAANLPVHAAAITGVTMPSLAPGQTGEAIVTVENRGSATWVDGFRLGAAPGCPDAADANAVDWTPATGYANSLVDARVYLPGSVAPGASIDIHVPIRAPANEGSYTFAARMVHEGVAWFGATASDTLVVAAQAGSGSGSGSDDAGHGGGCQAGGGSCGAMVLVVLALARRRVRRW